MGTQSGMTPAAADAAEGAELTYALAGAGGMGETVPGTISLMKDGTVKLHVDGFGPFGGCDATGTWTAADGVYTLIWD